MDWIKEFVRIKIIETFKKNGDGWLLPLVMEVNR